MVKGIVEFDEERCKGCELCIAVCPKKILALHKIKFNKKGYHPAGAVDPDSCTGCGSCAVMCPDGVISVYRED